MKLRYFLRFLIGSVYWVSSTSLWFKRNLPLFFLKIPVTYGTFRIEKFESCKIVPSEYNEEGRQIHTNLEDRTKEKLSVTVYCNFLERTSLKIPLIIFNSYRVWEWITYKDFSENFASVRACPWMHHSLFVFASRREDRKCINTKGSSTNHVATSGGRGSKKVREKTTSAIWKVAT